MPERIAAKLAQREPLLRPNSHNSPQCYRIAVCITRYAQCGEQEEAGDAGDSAHGMLRCDHEFRQFRAGSGPTCDPAVSFASPGRPFLLPPAPKRCWAMARG